VQLTGIRQNTSNPGTSNVIAVILTVQNKGDTAAEDVSISLGGLSSSSFTLSGAFGDKQLGKIEPGESASATIDLYVSQSLSNGNYPLTVMIKYSDTGEGGAFINSDSMEVYIYVNRPEKVETEEKQDGSVPRVIIGNYSISVETVVAGGPFELAVTLLNTSVSKNVKNLKVTVTDKDGIFIPVAGVNSFYIPELPIGQTADIVITLMPKQDAETKSFPVSISLDYEDAKDVPYAVTESLSIPVYQPQRLEIMNVMFYEDGMGTAMLSFQFINKGKSSLYNMNIRVEGPMTAMEGDYYVGTFAAGQSDYLEEVIIPQMYGEIEGYIVIEYEDTSGTMQELRSPITAFISEPFFPDPGEWTPIEPGPGWPGMEGGDESEGGGIQGWLLWAVIGGAVLICGIAAIVVVKKIKRRKFEMDDDE
jgi:hypothetical protein